MKNLLLLGRINKEVGLLTKSGYKQKKAMTFTGYRSKSSIGISFP